MKGENMKSISGGPRISGYIGTYTHGIQGRARGIYYFEMDGETGCIGELRLAAQAANPSWLTLSPSGKQIYAVNETGDFQGSGGGLSAYAVEKDGFLRFINSKRSRGSLPCYIALNDRATHAIAANYDDGVLAVFPLGRDGGLGDPCQIVRFSGSGTDRDRQQGPHAHSFMFDRACRYGFSCDLGTDRVMAYRFDSAAGEPLKPAENPWYSTAPGAGPRHGVFNSAGTHAYILNEMSSVVDVVKYDPESGAFENLQRVSALPKGAAVQTNAAALRLGPGGAFLYASNRGHDSIAVFTVKEGTGTLGFCGAVPCGGKTPRDINITPEGNFLLACNQDTDNLAVFRIDRAAGSLTKIREYAVPSPACVVFC
jgi:6-phosphogluconolactonase